MGTSVGGLIGGKNDDPLAVSRHLDQSLVAMHRGLRPEACPAPAELVEFDKELATAPRERRAEPVAPRTKDSTNFINTTCHDFQMSGGTLHWWNCVYTQWMNRVETSVSICPACGDASFFWNVDSPLAGDALYSGSVWNSHHPRQSTVQSSRPPMELQRGRGDGTIGGGGTAGQSGLDQPVGRLWHGRHGALVGIDRHGI